ncbi:MFS transporter [Carnimonas nigrificans]|uniref:MFS transporter n=1 Tax=Carnimonas nigrificans TaxID=64323 RepID=UPI00046FED89|nr:MFS transporter [Carnimonas nigrificans]
MTASQPPTMPALSKGRAILALFALALGTFGIGTGEFSLMGLLPQVASSTGSSESQAGYLISIYALGVVVGAPLLAVCGAALPRRLLLILMLVLCVIANVVTGFVSHFGSLMVVRFIAGLPHGAFFGVAALTGASLVEPRHRGKAVGRVMLGLTLSTLLGNPLSVWIGQLSNWHMAYVMVGVICAISAVLIVLFVPNDHHMPRSSPLQELGALKNPDIWLTLAIGSTGFGGMFCVLSFIAPTITHVSHLSASWVPATLAIFGVGTIIGSQVGGAMADKGTMRAAGIFLVWTLVVMVLFTPLSYSSWTVLPAVFLVGTCMGLTPPLQVRLMDVGKNAQTLAASLNHSAFNLANALGAWLGGVSATVTGSWAMTGWSGAILALVGLAVYALALRRSLRRKRARLAAAHAE